MPAPATAHIRITDIIQAMEAGAMVETAVVGEEMAVVVAEMAVVDIS